MIEQLTADGVRRSQPSPMYLILSGRFAMLGRLRVKSPWLKISSVPKIDLAGVPMEGPFALGTVEVASSPRARFEEFLQTRGKRITQQRRLIVDEVFRRHEHFDAEDLIQKLQAELGSRKVSRPTVYRTLAELVDAGLLRDMVLGGRAIYEHDYGYPQHDHLYCEKCHKLIEFRSEALEQLRESAAREHHFKATGHRLIIFGTCNDCRAPSRPLHKVDLI